MANKKDTLYISFFGPQWGEESEYSASSNTRLVTMRKADSSTYSKARAQAVADIKALRQGGEKVHHAVLQSGNYDGAVIADDIRG